MKIGRIVGATNRYGAVYTCLGGSFALSWSSHCMAFEKMNADHRLVTLVNDHTVRTIARMMDWVAAHSWLAVAYFIAVVAFVTFLQIRGRPPWTHWLAALSFCGPCLLYWSARMLCATLLVAR
jgi:hypothetical protein